MAIRYCAIGYHGTDRSSAQSIETTGFRLDTNSKNSHMSWLGDGAYFWDNDRFQAWHWVTNGPRYARANVPVVIEASLDLTAVLDLTTDEGRAKFQHFVERFLADEENKARFLQAQRHKGHQADAFFLDALSEFSGGLLQSVRAVVMRGQNGFRDRAKQFKYPDQVATVARSRIVTNINTIICVRNTNRIGTMEVSHVDPR